MKIRINELKKKLGVPRKTFTKREVREKLNELKIKTVPSPKTGTKTVEGVEIVLAAPKSPPDVSEEIEIGKLDVGQRFREGERIGVVKRHSNESTEVQFDGESSGTTISKNSFVVKTNGEEIVMAKKQKTKIKSQVISEKKAKENSKVSLKTERKQNGKTSAAVSKKGSKPVRSLKQDTIKEEFRAFLESKNQSTHEVFLKVLSQKFPESIFGKHGTTVESIELKKRINFYKTRLGVS